MFKYVGSFLTLGSLLAHPNALAETTAVISFEAGTG
jgi:hypothetical protein